MSETPGLFDAIASEHRPLADRMRPRKLSEFVGQRHLLAEGKPLRNAIESGRPHSMILWGPPGTGKTTLARLIASQCRVQFLSLSAVLSGVKEIRAAIEQAKTSQGHQESATVLFVDEVHRFNKAQQDAFLPYIEDGTICFIGATTENPSFELNNALLSRARTYVLKSLECDDIMACLHRALEDKEHGLGGESPQIDVSCLQLLADASDGDARRALTHLELAAELSQQEGRPLHIAEQAVRQVIAGNVRRFDKQGEYFYDLISALHKSIRGTDPQAALYWCCRMLDGGCDPVYIARRLVRIASEDIGNADLRGLTIALQAWDSYERLGSPEGELAIAQAVVYLACAPKSNAVYKAYKLAMQDVHDHGSLEVPLHLRNAPTRLMKELGYGKDYQYAHDHEGAYVENEQYLPDALQGMCYYEPVDRGLEIKIGEMLERLRGTGKKHLKNKE